MQRRECGRNTNALALRTATGMIPLFVKRVRLGCSSSYIASTHSYRRTRQQRRSCIARAERWRRWTKRGRERMKQRGNEVDRQSWHDVNTRVGDDEAHFHPSVKMRCLCSHRGRGGMPASCSDSLLFPSLNDSSVIKDARLTRLRCSSSNSVPITSRRR